MNPIRVVIADDSPFMVRTLMSYLRSDSRFEIVGTALNGPRAVQLVEKLKPDVVTLDIEMPGWERSDDNASSTESDDHGLQALTEIMQRSAVPVVMVSGVSARAADVTLHAIEVGAVDFILKYTPGEDSAPDSFRREFLEKVNSAAQVRVVRSLPVAERSEVKTESPAPATVEVMEPVAVEPSVDLPTQRSAIDQLYELVNSRDTSDGSGINRRSVWQAREDEPGCSLVVIGASTGGPTVLRELLGELPGDFPVPIVVVQHMPASFTGVLAAQLDRRLDLRVREAWDGDSLAAGTVLIAPGDRHLVIESDGSVRLTDGEKVGGHRPSVNVTMDSAVQAFGSGTSGVLLTGMGEDGAAGLLKIREAGGRTMVQRADTCVVNGMPARAMEAGAAELSATPLEISQRLRMMFSATVCAGP